MVYKVPTLLEDIPLRATAAFAWEWYECKQRILDECQLLPRSIVENRAMWRRVAAAIEQVRVLPETYIYATWRTTAGRVNVNSVHSPATQSRCRKYISDIPANLQGQLRSSAQHLMVRVRQRELAGANDASQWEAAASILSEWQSTLSPLFRFCAATRLSDKAMCDRLYPKAIEQYAATPREYDVTWGDYIPVAIRDTVDSYLEMRMRWLIRD